MDSAAIWVQCRDRRSKLGSSKKTSNTASFAGDTVWKDQGNTIIQRPIGLQDDCSGIRATMRAQGSGPLIQALRAGSVSATETLMGGPHWLTHDRRARLGPYLAFSHAWLEATVDGCARYANQYDMTMSEALENEIYVQLCGERTERVREVARLIQVIRSNEILNDDLIERTQWLTELSLFMLRETDRGWRPKVLRNRRIRHGLAKKGLFDGDAYLVRYPDVAAAGVDPLIHYVLHGMAEGRKR